ncbi:MMPL family transporter [Natribaculum luteum]|uniref:MMPL family transporter n=1 Tax=Natribaculum luteum TaxID=1586232 RepID=A0ABD5NTY6_9EURY|nr:MMPL family transporter [Natribaculum luteum]
MSRADRLAAAVTTRTRLVLAAFVLVTVLLGSGVTALEVDSSLEQFESESPEARALEYVEQNFSTGRNETRVQVVVEGEDVLSRESLLASLEFQRAIRDDESIDATLADETPIVGVENVVATGVIREERAAKLETQAADLERRGEELNATGNRLETALDRAEKLQREYERVNESYAAGTVSEREYERRAAEIEAGFERARENATAPLDDAQTDRFEQAMAQIRRVEAERVATERERDAGEIDDATYDYRIDQLASAREDARTAGTVGVLADEYERLRAEQDRLEAERRALESTDQPPLEEQIAALEALNESAYEAALERFLAGGGPAGDAALRLLPSSYEPGSTTADARMTVLTQSSTEGALRGPGTIDDDLVDTQLEVREMAADRDREYVVVGSGIVADEIDRSMGDSVAIVAPLALAFVALALLVAYRDLLDVVLGVAGVLVVLLWTLGIMGWAGIAFNQAFVAVPVLLIGLSIDYAIHVFMRHRERRETDTADGTRASMAVALAGVGVALAWVTATTAVGFLANLVSPIAPVREFGVVSAVGILAALVVFGAMIPAAKVELDSFLESHGFDRRKRAFGTGDRFSRMLSLGAVAARRAPLAVLVATLLVTAGGVYGATQADTSFDQRQFLAEEPPAWTDRLPDPVRPGEYSVKDDIESVERTFQRDATVQILVRGDVTDGETLERIADAEAVAEDSVVVSRLANGEADVRSPLSAIEARTADDDSLDATYQLADRSGDGVPDQNLESLYDRLFELDPATANDLLSRTADSEYEALRLVVSVRGNASSAETATAARDVAAAIDDGDDGRWTAVATGGPVVTHVLERAVLETVLEGLVVTLALVVVVLSLAYRATGTGATLGVVTLAPVAIALSWTLGTMALVDVPLNVLTGTITSLTIGLGVAYSIHVSSRYALELERQGDVAAALSTAVTGTGGALLGSAATTVGGFGTLALATVPVLRQFGVVTALTIVYSFLASVLVLPTLLVLWTRYLGSDVPGEPTAVDGRRSPVAERRSDGDPDASDDD